MTTIFRRVIEQLEREDERTAVLRRLGVQDEKNRGVMRAMIFAGAFTTGLLLTSLLILILF